MDPSSEKSTEVTAVVPIDTTARRLEVQVLEGGRERRFPFLEEGVRFTLEDGSECLLTGSGGGVFRLTHETLAQALIVNEKVRVLAATVRILDTSNAERARLVGVSEPFTGRSWPVLEEPTPVGRPGKRWNLVALEHPTVSRTHALIHPVGRHFELLAQAVAATSVDGVALSPGESARLGDGAVIQLGDLFFRWHLSTAVEQAPLLAIRCLGDFEVCLGGRRCPISNRKARWLLARLAAQAGRRLPVRAVLGDNWPGSDELQARKNLSHTLVQLRKGLGLSLEAFDLLLERDPDGLRLNPAWLGEFDLAPALAVAEPLDPQTRELLSRPFLPECDQQWAVRIRERLERKLDGGSEANRNPVW